MNPYLYFSKLKRSEVRSEVDGDEAFAELSGGKRNAEATKRLGVLWKALSEEDKRRYKDEAPLIKCKKRKSTKKRKSVEAPDAPAFDPEVCGGVPFRPSRIGTGGSRSRGDLRATPVMVIKADAGGGVAVAASMEARVDPARSSRRDGVEWRSYALADTHTEPSPSERLTAKNDAGPRRRVRPALRDRGQAPFREAPGGGRGDGSSVRSGKTRRGHRGGHRRRGGRGGPGGRGQAGGAGGVHQAALRGGRS